MIRITSQDQRPNPQHVALLDDQQGAVAALFGASDEVILPGRVIRQLVPGQAVGELIVRVAFFIDALPELVISGTHVIEAVTKVGKGGNVLDDRLPMP